MNILNKIVAHKRKEVDQKKELYPAKLLEQSIYCETTPVSLKEYLRRPDAAGIIAEIKRKSPSKGVINQGIDVEKLSIGYMQAGASALSILTDTSFFGGTNEDLTQARKFNFCPILRKDFVVDEYQILEARSIGADVVLLIAKVLTPKEIASFATMANQLGLEVLLEVHGLDELQASLHEHVDVVGVNNRNLDDFSVSVARSFSLIEHIPKSMCSVSESGLQSAETICELRRAGFDGFLIGESFMKTSQPAEACRRLIKEIQKADVS